MVARPEYVAPRYAAVPQHVYEQYRDITARHGQVEKLERPLPIALTDQLAFLPGTAAAVPAKGDEIGVGVTGRLDIFTARGRHFALTES